MAKEQTFKRKEIKYLLSDEQYRALMPVLEGYARVDEYGETRINNIYYDTPDYRLIRASLEKPVYKEKLRLRTYGATADTTRSFVEIKKKYKGIVYKRRFSLDYSEAEAYLRGDMQLPESSRTQITDEVDEFLSFYENLQPAMIIGYNRIAMAGIADPDFRVTFDTGITWRTDRLDLRQGTEGNLILGEGQHLMEIKIRDAFPIELSRALSSLMIFPASFSKYGRAYMDYMTETRCECFYTLMNAADNRANIQKTLRKGEMAYA